MDPDPPKKKRTLAIKRGRFNRGRLNQARSLSPGYGRTAGEKPKVNPISATVVDCQDKEDLYTTDKETGLDSMDIEMLPSSAMEPTDLPPQYDHSWRLEYNKRLSTSQEELEIKHCRGKIKEYETWLKGMDGLVVKLYILWIGMGQDRIGWTCCKLTTGEQFTSGFYCSDCCDAVSMKKQIQQTEKMITDGYATFGFLLHDLKLKEISNKKVPLIEVESVLARCNRELLKRSLNCKLDRKEAVFEFIRKFELSKQNSSSYSISSDDSTSDDSTASNSQDSQDSQDSPLPKGFYRRFSRLSPISSFVSSRSV